jgi:outer membrane protein TolC
MPGTSLARLTHLGAFVILEALLVGCAPRSAGVSGIEQRIMEDLARDGVPMPAGDSSGQTPAAEQRASLPETGPITLAELLRVAQARHPAVAAARSDVGIAAGQIWQASLYPNPSLEVASEEVPFGSGFEQGVSTISIIQPIVLGDRLKAAAGAAEAEKAARVARVELSIRELFGDVAQLHARLLAIRQADALYSQLAGLGDQTLSMARTRYEARAAK